MTRRVSTCAAVALLLAGLGSPAQQPPAPTLPDEAYPQMLHHSVTTLQSILGGKPDRAGLLRAQNTALLLAACAQQNLAGKDAQQRATVRDAALVVYGLARAGKAAEAFAVAQTIPTLPADPKAKAAKVNVLAGHAFEDLPAQFRKVQKGDDGIEAKLMALDQKGGVRAADLDDNLLRMAYQTAVVAELFGEYRVGIANQPRWQRLADDLRDRAVDLADAVKKKDAKAAQAAVKGLNTACMNCHDAAVAPAGIPLPQPPK